MMLKVVLIYSVSATLFHLVYVMLHRSVTSDPQWAFLEFNFQLIKFSCICFAHEVTGRHSGADVCRRCHKFYCETVKYKYEALI